MDILAYYDSIKDLTAEQLAAALFGNSGSVINTFNDAHYGWDVKDDITRAAMLLTRFIEVASPDMTVVSTALAARYEVRKLTEDSNISDMSAGATESLRKPVMWLRPANEEDSAPTELRSLISDMQAAYLAHVFYATDDGEEYAVQYLWINTSKVWRRTWKKEAGASSGAWDVSWTAVQLPYEFDKLEVGSKPIAKGSRTLAHGSGEADLYENYKVKRYTCVHADPGAGTPVYWIAAETTKSASGVSGNKWFDYYMQTAVSPAVYVRLTPSSHPATGTVYKLAITEAREEERSSISVSTPAYTMDGVDAKTDGDTGSTLTINNIIAAASGNLEKYQDAAYPKFNAAIGADSSTDGRNLLAIGEASHAQGIGTVAKGDGQAVFGRYNKPDENAYFVVGNGADEEHRHNAFEVKEDGAYVNENKVSAPHRFFAEDHPSSGRSQGITFTYYSGTEELKATGDWNNDLGTTEGRGTPAFRNLFGDETYIDLPVGMAGKPLYVLYSSEKIACAIKIKGYNDDDAEVVLCEHSVQQDTRIEVPEEATKIFIRYEVAVGSTDVNETVRLAEFWDSFTNETLSERHVGISGAAKALEELSSHEYYTKNHPTSKSAENDQGIAFTYDSGSKKLTAKGTWQNISGDSTAPGFTNLFSGDGYAQMPAGMAGKPLYVIYSAEKIKLRINIKKDGDLVAGPFIVNRDTKIDVPADANKIFVRYEVGIKTTVDETVNLARFCDKYKITTLSDKAMRLYAHMEETSSDIAFECYTDFADKIKKWIGFNGDVDNDASTNFWHSQLLPIRGGQTYYVTSNVSSTDCVGGFYDENKKWICGIKRSKLSLSAKKGYTKNDKLFRSSGCVESEDPDKNEVITLSDGDVCFDVFTGKRYTYTEGGDPAFVEFDESETYEGVVESVAVVPSYEEGFSTYYPTNGAADGADYTAYGDGPAGKYLLYYKFTAPFNARYLVLNLGSESTIQKTCLSSKPVFIIGGTGNFSIRKDDPLYQHTKNRKLCMIGPSTVMIDRLMRSARASIGIQYGISDDHETAPTEWRKVVAGEWCNGHYLWSRIRKTDVTNAITRYTEPVKVLDSIAENVRSVKSEYYLSTTKTGQSGDDDGWKESLKTWTSGKYYWARSKIYYTNNTQGTSTPVLVSTLESPEQRCNGHVNENPVELSGYISGSQEYLAPYYDEVVSFGYSSAAYAADAAVSDNTEKTSICSRICGGRDEYGDDRANTREDLPRKDLSGYDDFVLYSSGNGIGVTNVGDVTTYNDKRTYAGALHKIVEQIFEQNPRARVFLLTMSTKTSEGDELERRLAANEQIALIAEKFGCGLIDRKTDSVPNALTSSYWLYDGTHLNNIGNRMFGLKIRKAILGIN